MQSFEEAYQQCNAAQQAAIDQTEGPVMVLAGPGTGKTQILALRICKILQNTDVVPENILCLTYTDAGRVAMRKRLARFMGADAYRVGVHTFHSFCNEIIRNNSGLFPVAGEAKPLDELGRARIIKKIFDEMDEENPLRKFKGDIYSSRYALIQLYTEIKKEKLDPDFLIERAEKLSAELPLMERFLYKRKYKEFNAGDVKQKDVDTARLKLDEFIAAARSYHRYEALKAEAGAFDFDDMLLWVINAFEQNPDLLFDYQERYQYILVDEFQDNNGAQYTLVSLLASYWEDNPNLFVVGDDDQSIYSFQGAEHRRLKDFVFTYKKHLTTVVLTENYRSSQEILDAAKKIFTENSGGRLVNDTELKALFAASGKTLHKNLVAKNPEFASGTGGVRLMSFDKDYSEIVHVFKEILAAHRAGEDLSEIAVIFGKHRMSEPYIKLFEKYEIPYNASKTENLLELPLIQKLWDLLRLIHAETYEPDLENELLFRVMHFDFINLPATDVDRMMFAHSQSGSYAPLRRVIANDSFLEKNEITSGDAIKYFHTTLEHAQADAFNHTLQVHIDKVVENFGLRSFLLKHPERAELIQQLNGFYEFVKERTAAVKQYHIAELLDDLATLTDFGVSIPYYRMAVRANGVNLLTAHGSKGLEFEKVYLIQALANEWEKRKNAGGKTFTIPPLTDEEMYAWGTGAPLRDVDTAGEEEAGRLFYVALTRAKKRLTVSWPLMKFKDMNMNKSTNEPSMFYTALVAGEEQGNPASVDMNELQEYGEVLVFGQKPYIAQLEQSLIEKRLHDYRLSVTDLSKFLRCPVTFYYEKILQVPSARSADMGFGNAMHHALKKFFDLYKGAVKDTPGEAALPFFEEGMKLFHSHFTPREFQDKLTYGRLMLPEYIDLRRPGWNAETVLTEYKIDDVLLDNLIPLKGNLDRVDLYDTEAIVTDYKTSQLTQPKAFMRAPAGLAPTATHEQTYGGDTWRQVIFYKLLIDGHRGGKWVMKHGLVDALIKKQDGTFEQKRIEVSEEDLFHVKEQIRAAWEAIMAHRFSPGCGDENCKWCNLASNNFQLTVNGENYEINEEQE